MLRDTIMTRYFIGIVAVIALLIFLIVMIVNSNNKPTLPNSTATLQSYAHTNAVASVIIDGPITAPQTHNSVKILISNTSSTIELIKGYNNNIIKSQTFSNSEASYSAFLHSLEYAGFTQGNASPKLSNPSGYCPLGDRYTFELTQNNKTLEKYWSTNCGGTPNTFAGHLGLTLTLFQQQIPDYGNITQNANI